MDLKELLGADYKEGMTLDEVSAALESKTFVPSEQLSNKVDKALFDKLSSDLAAAKKKERELMSDEEQRLAAEAEKDTRIAALEKESKTHQLVENFISGGYDAVTAKELAVATVDADYTKISTINSNFMTAREEALRVQIKEDLLKDSGGAGGAGGGGNEDDIATQTVKGISKSITESNEVAQTALNYYTGGN